MAHDYDRLAEGAAPQSRASGRQPINAGYRYRGTQPAAPDPLTTSDIREALKRKNLLLSIVSSRIRALAANRTEELAKALQDGIKVTVLAKAASLPRQVVRRAGLSLADVEPPGLPRKAHLRAVTVLQEELQELQESKTAIEHQRLKILATGRRRLGMDDYELASSSGLTAETVRKLLSQHKPNAAP